MTVASSTARFHNVQVWLSPTCTVVDRSCRDAFFFSRLLKIRIHASTKLSTNGKTQRFQA